MQDFKKLFASFPKTLFWNLKNKVETLTKLYQMRNVSVQESSISQFDRSKRPVSPFAL
jgi:hypothetical protein